MSEQNDKPLISHTSGLHESDHVRMNVVMRGRDTQDPRLCAEIRDRFGTLLASTGAIARDGNNFVADLVVEQERVPGGFSTYRDPVTGQMMFRVDLRRGEMSGEIDAATSTALAGVTLQAAPDQRADLRGLFVRSAERSPLEQAVAHGRMNAYPEP